jgi:uncharacterized cupin superfamily protein
LQPAKQAAVKNTETGKVVDGEGWFVLNLAEARWEGIEGSGAWCPLEADDAPFEHFGANVHVLWPGQASGLYHAESNQEGFFVLAGECIAIVERRELPLRQWDYLHCPPGTHHITVGAGEGPCAILMLGARLPDRTIQYPVDETAARYGASVTRATDSAREAYADLPGAVTPQRSPWPPASP